MLLCVVCVVEQCVLWAQYNGEINKAHQLSDSGPKFALIKAFRTQRGHSQCPSHKLSISFRQLACDRPDQ